MSSLICDRERNGFTPIPVRIGDSNGRHVPCPDIDRQFTISGVCNDHYIVIQFCDVIIEIEC